MTDIGFPAGNKEAIQLWHKVVLDMVSNKSNADLSNRQIAILLTVATERGPHSVKSLSEYLSVSKPAICRALDSLSRFDMAERVVDPKDRRIVYVQPTAKGREFLIALSETIMTNLLEIA